MFLGRKAQPEEARLEVLWRPREGTDVQRVQWIDDQRSLGWHKDDDHPELGTTHFQVESPAGIRHEEGRIEVEAPLSFLEVCLDRLAEYLDEAVRRP